MAPVGPLDKVLIKREICMGGQYINIAAFRVSIQYDPIVWVWEPHEKDHKCGYPDMVVTSESGLK